MPIKSVLTVRCIGPGRESSCRSPLIYRTIFRKYVGDKIISLHPATCEEDLAKCVDTMKGNIDVKAVMCTRMKSKYEALYHVAVQVDSALLGITQAVDVFMSGGAWLAGVFVKRFFQKAQWLSITAVKFLFVHIIVDLSRIVYLK